MRSSGSSGFDVIGDVHGYAGKLVALLEAMAYELLDGVWTHPCRRAVFVGDLIDRGPEQLQVINIARSMVEADTAEIVLGNHEFNAVAWHTPDPDGAGHLRPHDERRREQHEAFLDQIGEGSDTHDEIIAWFKTLPLWLELDGLRIVHACWDENSMREIRGMLGPGDTLTEALVVAASRENSAEWRAIEHLLKGPEIPLPEPYRDSVGYRRSQARFRWWIPSVLGLRTAVVIPGDATTVDGDVYPELPDASVDAPVAPYRDEVPVIYGHFWETGRPTVSGPHTACVDYSAGKGGPLVAYRWSGESELVDDNFISSDHG